jgi:rare lipoprotein A
MKKTFILYLYLAFFSSCLLLEEGRQTVQFANAIWHEENVQGELSAYHASIPVGTRVRVTNMKNGRKVIVTVAGSMPFSEYWDIDISKEAARNIELDLSGITPVKIETLSRRKVFDHLENEAGPSSSYYY